MKELLQLRKYKRVQTNQDYIRQEVKHLIKRNKIIKPEICPV